MLLPNYSHAKTLCTMISATRNVLNNISLFFVALPTWCEPTQNMITLRWSENYLMWCIRLAREHYDLGNQIQINLYAMTGKHSEKSSYLATLQNRTISQGRLRQCVPKTGKVYHFDLIKYLTCKIYERWFFLIRNTWKKIFFTQSLSGCIGLDLSQTINQLIHSCCTPFRCVTVCSFYFCVNCSYDNASNADVPQTSKYVFPNGPNGESLALIVRMCRQAKTCVKPFFSARTHFCASFGGLPQTILSNSSVTPLRTLCRNTCDGQRSYSLALVVSFAPKLYWTLL